MKRCEGCGLDKGEAAFAWRDKAQSVRHTTCRECKNRYNRSWYANHKSAHKENVARNAKRYRATAREIVLAAKDVPCMDCLRTFPPYAMDFDHPDGVVKVAEIARMSGRHSRDKLRKEIA